MLPTPVEYSGFAQQHLSMCRGLTTSTLINMNLSLTSVRAESFLTLYLTSTLSFTRLLPPHVSSSPSTSISIALSPFVEHLQGSPAGDPRLLLFDAYHDEYRGVVCLVQLRDGSVAQGDRLTSMATGDSHDVLEVGGGSHLRPSAVTTGAGNRWATIRHTGRIAECWWSSQIQSVRHAVAASLFPSALCTPCSRAS